MKVTYLSFAFFEVVNALHKLDDDDLRLRALAGLDVLCHHTLSCDLAECLQRIAESFDDDDDDDDDD